MKEKRESFIERCCQKADKVVNYVRSKQHKLAEKLPYELLKKIVRSKITFYIILIPLSKATILVLLITRNRERIKRLFKKNQENL